MVFFWLNIEDMEKIQENPIGGILPTIQANPNLKIESISNQIILKVKSIVVEEFSFFIYFLIFLYV